MKFFDGQGSQLLNNLRDVKKPLSKLDLKEQSLKKQTLSLPQTPRDTLMMHLIQKIKQKTTTDHVTYQPDDED